MKKKHQLILIGVLLLIPDPIPFIDEGVLLAFFIKTLTDIVKERKIGRSKRQEEEIDDNGPIIDID
ncbi:hypothetical protein N9868_00595 [Akkermansiaceae bacterium]|nr:hypothetical protein [Akkermansiaceae bacterium]MDB4272183.1 hypothetical protein [bacterium]MDA7672673.1 hypothetical protein [Akkermansiaceae bacterium]MDB0055969.1 hypothetical protein [Akkermansiaceae bacterium]MDB4262247.1 hypothetical protein [Akkermansiaceae bacterium]